MERALIQNALLNLTYRNSNQLFSTVMLDSITKIIQSKLSRSFPSGKVSLVVNNIYASSSAGEFDVDFTFSGLCEHFQNESLNNSDNSGYFTWLKDQSKEKLVCALAGKPISAVATVQMTIENDIAIVSAIKLDNKNDAKITEVLKILLSIVRKMGLLPIKYSLV